MLPRENNPLLAASPKKSRKHKHPSIRPINGEAVDEVSDSETAKKVEDGTLRVRPSDHSINQVIEENDDQCCTCGGSPSGDICCICINTDNGSYHPIPDTTPFICCGTFDCNCPKCDCNTNGKDDAGVVLAICFIVVSGAVVIGTTVGGAVYTGYEVVKAFQESIPEGTFQSTVAAAGGLGGWFLSELFSEMVAKNLEPYIQHDVTKYALQIWGSTMGAALTTGIKRGIEACCGKTSSNRATLFGGNNNQQSYLPQTTRDVQLEEAPPNYGSITMAGRA